MMIFLMFLLEVCLLGRETQALTSVSYPSLQWRTLKLFSDVQTSQVTSSRRNNVNKSMVEIVFLWIFSHVLASFTK